MSLTYATYLATLANLVPISQTDGDFTTVLPSIIDYAEQRIYRELDLISTVSASATPFTANSRNLAIPGSILIVNSVNVVTPANTAPDAGTRNPCQRISLEALNYFWPALTGVGNTGVPQYYALLDNLNVRFGPTPDQTYQAEFIGIVRPAPLSASNTTTFLSTYLPDLFLAASMIFVTGWQRDFGQMADDPQAAQSWENQYQQLRQSAQVEEARRKAASTAWQPFSPQPAATPARQ